MKICVLGAGVIGVSTAYMLTRAGHDVTLIDKADGPASGTSKANGAQLAYSYVEPFASPATAVGLPRYFLGLDPGIKLGLSLKPSYWAWGLRFLANCRRGKYLSNYKERDELARRSKAALQTIERELPENTLKRTGGGKLVLADTEVMWDNLVQAAKGKPDYGPDLQFLNKSECLKRFPTLSSRTGTFYGGIYCDSDEALDTQIFCKVLLTANINNHKPNQVFGEHFKRLEIKNDRVASVVTDKNVYECDAVIGCLGGDTNKALRAYIKPLSIYPIQGYSVTLPATKSTPTCSITDLKHKFVIANLGDKVRIAGFMDANLNDKRSRARAEELLELTRRLWPDIADYSAEPNFWIGRRPMTPSGLPVIKESKTPGLYINAGHGSLGYTLAAGSASAIAEAIGPA